MRTFVEVEEKISKLHKATREVSIVDNPSLDKQLLVVFSWLSALRWILELDGDEE